MWRDARRSSRYLLAASLVFAALVWNLVFDASVRAGALEYLEQHAAWRRGAVPRPTLRGVMEPVIADGARKATGWAGLVLAAELAALSLGRKRRLRSASIP